jgi:hypothetical protein
MTPAERADALASFPAERLRADLCARFGSVSAAAKHAGILHPVVHGWLRRHHWPEVASLRRLLEACGLEFDPYRRFLEPPQLMKLVCPEPTCGYRRTRPRSDLRSIMTGAKGRATLVRRPDGAYEVPCQRHSSGRRTALRQRQERQLYETLGPKKARLATRILDELKKRKPDPTALKMWSQALLAPALGHALRDQIVAELRRPTPNLAAVDSAISTALAARNRQRRLNRPRSARARHNIAIARLIARFSRRPLSLCPLCELATSRFRWHGDCYATWQRWSGHPPSPQNWPPRTRTRGPSPERDLRRNLYWLLAQRAHKRTRRALAADAGVGETTVREGALASLWLLPGRWGALYTSGCDRRSNRTRQRCLPLPEDPEFQAIIERGERDPLIRRLHGFDMPEGDIARITGASLERIRGVLTRATSTATASA